MLKGYRTVIFNVIMGAIMIGEATGFFDVPAGVDVAGSIDTVDAALAIVWATGNFVLRAITDSPIFGGDTNEE